MTWLGLFCCLCFEGLTPGMCAIDSNGERWDVCWECAAMEPGWPHTAPATLGS